MTWQFLEGQKNIHTSRYAKRILLLASIILSNIIFFNFLFFSHISNYQGYGYYGAIFWTVLLLLLASYMELLPCVLRQIRRVSAADAPSYETPSTEEIELK